MSTACAMFLIEALPLYCLMIGAVVGAVCIYRLAPVQHPNAPFGTTFAKRMKSIVRWITSVLLAAMGLSLIWWSHLSACVAISLCFSGLSMIAARYQAAKLP